MSEKVEPGIHVQEGGGVTIIDCTIEAPLEGGAVLVISNGSAVAEYRSRALAAEVEVQRLRDQLDEAKSIMREMVEKHPGWSTQVRAFLARVGED